MPLQKKPVITGENACHDYLERAFYVSLCVIKCHAGKSRVDESESRMDTNADE